MKDAHYMHRALQLAKLGLGSTSINPMVGCVIVYNNSIIGEGWHQQYGKEHAEVNAINSVVDKSLLTEAVVYVNLEPCSYYGKTPACSDLLIKSKVKKVVIACLDPNPKVAGKGVNALKEAGIDVQVGMVEQESIELNKRFFINQKLNRPYIILKWAATNDGFIARKNYDSKWISNEYSRQRVHQWRAEEDAILVGKNTAKHDNPSLTVRDWHGNNPTRIVLDRNLELNPELNLFNNEAKTLVYNYKENKTANGIDFIKLNANNFLMLLVEDLYRRNIGSIIIEGGSQVLSSFIKIGLWDEARIFTSTKEFKEGINAPILKEFIGGKQTINKEDTLRHYYSTKTASYWQKN